MGIFDLPPVEGRKKSKLLFQYLNVEGWSDIRDPDYYIIYRLGHDMRYLSFFYAVILFSVCVLYRYFGFFPSLPQPVVDETFLGLYLYYVNYYGIAMLLCFPYYFLLFKKNVQFSKYNILRENIETYGNVPSSQRISFPLLIITALIFVAKPSAITSIFYMYTFKGFFVQYFDTTLFVFLVSILVAFMHSFFAQILFRLTIYYSYFYYERDK